MLFINNLTRSRSDSSGISVMKSDEQVDSMEWRGELIEDVDEVTSSRFNESYDRRCIVYLEST